jgi:hypothetical protein
LLIFFDGLVRIRIPGPKCSIGHFGLIIASSIAGRHPQFSDLKARYVYSVVLCAYSGKTYLGQLNSHNPRPRATGGGSRLSTAQIQALHIT